MSTSEKSDEQSRSQDDIGQPEATAEETEINVEDTGAKYPAALELTIVLAAMCLAVFLYGLVCHTRSYLVSKAYTDALFRTKQSSRPQCPGSPMISKP